VRGKVNSGQWTAGRDSGFGPPAGRAGVRGSQRRKFIVHHSSFIVLFLFAVHCSLAAALAARLHTSGFETNNGTQTEWDAVSNGTFSTGTVHSGTYSGNVNITTSTGYFQRSFTAKTSGTLWIRAFFYYSTLPSTGDANIIQGGSSGPLNVRVVASSSKFRLRNSITTTQVDSTMTVSTGT